MTAAMESQEFLLTSCEFTTDPEEKGFLDFTEHGDLLDIIDFDDLFGVAGDVLPDLEMDPEILAGELSDHVNAASTITTTSSSEKTDSQGETNKKGIWRKGEEVVSKRDHNKTHVVVNYDRKRKYSSSASSKNKVISNNELAKPKVKKFRAPVAGIQAPPPHHMVYNYKSDLGFGGTRPVVDLHPSKESVDAAIGDVLTRPWLPLPLGLKPPAVDGVMTELQRHGISEVPPAASCA
ncbi:unnamed protein product [Eruca vesicaria subsp. sativa]|uniref:Uncharacterized protein n=1 Tax=Eruca vesicaria subsp. sativa TaxID=29727 RepID=A0ABC8LPA3_ERUVS|nr:unnamed protein product [Eruca vesicaria subsp. sativa]